MIRKIARSILLSYYKPVEKFLEDPLGTQQNTLRYLIEHGRDSLYGTKYRFKDVKNDADFRAKVPLMAYEELRPYLDKIINEKKENVL